ncbi:Fc.00g080060.m01.CDS01 [Cosmosporella sp. VM-42]
MQITSDLAEDPAAVISAILDITEKQIIPLTRKNVADGNAPFSAAILRKSDLSSVVVSCNKYKESPLLHGETNCIREFFMLPESSRPPTTETVFFATHEPCSLCLSGISWTHFPTVYFLFTYEDTRDLLGVVGDIEILEEVFRVPAPCDTKETLAARPRYNKSNIFFTIKSLAELLDEVVDTQLRETLKEEIGRVKDLFNEFRKII